MSDSEVEAALTRSIDRRLRNVDPRSDTDDLLKRIERRHSRQRRWLCAAVLVALFVGGLAVYLVQPARTSSSDEGIVAASDGAPTRGISESTGAPKDVDAAVEAVLQAFHDAFDGGTPEKARLAATQDGAALAPLRAAARQFALARGFTEAQLAGTTIAIKQVDFVDRTHAAVVFTITIPGRGPVLTDRVGYAVREGDRWKVAVRTTCDLVSLNGVGSPCPPQS